MNGMRSKILALPAIVCAIAGSAAAAGYVPAPMYCADRAVKTLCPVVPSFIVPDPMLDVGVGYQGLSNDVTSAATDVQSPFDNMSWQMFVALNWKVGQGAENPKAGLAGDGPVVWRTYARPEDVFGGPVPNCPNPENLPRFYLISKSGGQGSTDDEFKQATGQPLIDVNGNWTLFERRLNDVEVNYIRGNRLDSLAGQQVFALQGKSVAFPIGDKTTTNGAVGAMEVKSSWRVVSEAEKARFYSIRALLDVEGRYVRDGKPLCATVTLGLTGLHITQNNGPQGALEPDFIWATFEHQDNVPLADAACDPVDTLCFKNIKSSPASPNICPATRAQGTYSFFNAACTGAVSNAPPRKMLDQKEFLWDRQPPYAGHYTTQQGATRCGTQATRCWKVYKLTDQLNAQWRAQLAQIGSVFANYTLVGTNWGGNVEPTPGTLANGAVPAFLGNSSMETYIQANPQVGNCTGCHTGATLAYEQPTQDPKKPKTFPADFSFLLGLAQKTCGDVDAGPIWNNQQAQQICPGVCTQYQLRWNGQWTTTQPAVMSVCGCCLSGG